MFLFFLISLIFIDGLFHRDSPGPFSLVLGVGFIGI